MKKSLLAVAVLGAFAGSAMATDVTLYGIVDTGLRYDHVKTGQITTDPSSPYYAQSVKRKGLSMKSGMNSGSRWGLKGKEDLGNGYSVGFVLESGFNSDTGAAGDKDRLFNRESTLQVGTPFGKFYAGRMGALIYGAGSVSKIGMISAFGTSFNDYVPQVQSTMSLAGRWDNAIAYESPSFAGLVIRAQYAMGKDGAENKANPAGNNRYGALSATYGNGPLNVFFGVDSTIYGHAAGEKGKESLTVTLGGNYDFGAAKVFGGAQYFKKVQLSTFTGFNTTTYGDLFNGGTDKVKGYGLNLSVSAPVFGGTAMAGISYMDAESVEENTLGYKNDIKRGQIALGYDYAFSKRTDVYTVVSYGKDKFKHRLEDRHTQKPSYASVMLGLRHKF